MCSLTQGFCSSVLTGSCTTENIAQWKERWRCPTLQIVDIQRYPRRPPETAGTASSSVPPVTSRFYMAASDGISLVWLVVPPGTEMDELIGTYELDIGSCVTLSDYTVFTAVNGYNVVIPVCATYSTNPLSLIGELHYDQALFSLSRKALITSQDVSGHPRGNASVEELAQVTLYDLLRGAESTYGNWAVVLRIIWKGHERGRSCRTGISVRGLASQASLPRCVTDCVGVDECGFAIPCEFWGPPGFTDMFKEGDGVLLRHGRIVWDDNDSSMATRICFGHRSVVRVMAAETLDNLPHHFTTFIGLAAKRIASVGTVIQDAVYGDIVTLVGLVRNVDAGVTVTTKRGRVFRLVVTLDDCMDPSLTITVALWGETAEKVDPLAKERWYFRDCMVREFQRRKTLSSTWSTVALRVADSPLPLMNNISGPPFGEGSVPGGVASSKGIQGMAHSPTECVSEEKQMQVALRLEDASPTLPVLVHVQHIVVPAISARCAGCHRFASLSGVNTSATCPSCGGRSLARQFRLQMTLSDGVRCVEGLGYTSVGESLFEMREDEFVALTEQSTSFEQTACEGLTGLTVLVWLLRQPAEELYLIVNCKQVHMATCAATLLSTIERAMISCDSTIGFN